MNDSNKVSYVDSGVVNYKGYPIRATVGVSDWDVVDGSYSPVFYEDPVLDSASWADGKVPGVVADSYEGFVMDGPYPLNPRGRTGSCGRGVLGKWGPNFAADSAITRVNPDSGDFEALLLIRSDDSSGKLWAMPGGMVDPGEVFSATAQREFKEEVGVGLDMSTARVVYRGYVYDPRNTDNAWMETTVAWMHVDDLTASGMKPKTSEEASKVEWVKVDGDLLDSMHASHGTFMKMVLDKYEAGVIRERSVKINVFKKLDRWLGQTVSDPGDPWYGGPAGRV